MRVLYLIGKTGTRVHNILFQIEDKSNSLLYVQNIMKKLLKLVFNPNDKVLLNVY